MSRTLKNTGSIFALSILLGWQLLISGCTKIDTLPMLEITVNDLNGSPVDGVLVALFDELDEWSMLENPVQAWKETGFNGRVLFRDLKEEVYYFYADGDSINNVGHEIRLGDPLAMNEIRKITIIVE